MTLFAGPASAHKPSDSYLNLHTTPGTTIDGRWDIALRDLEYALGLDTNGDAAITWGELKARREALFAYALGRLSLTRGGACTIRADNLRVTDHTDGSYAVLDFDADCPSAAEQLTVGYRLFFDLDPSHRGLLRLDSAAGTRTAVFGPHTSSQRFDLGSTGAGAAFVQYVVQGIHHIWIGTDHVLFLITLLLPAVLVRRQGRWRARESAGPAIIEVTKLITAFTVAHSITLALAVLGVVDLPSRLVESIIAFSVLAMALNNLVPVIPEGRWMLVFGFGLIHGFGFASVLGDLGLPAGALAVSLFGFNVGVEIGQLSIVAAALPAALLLRHTAFYRIVVLWAGSAIVAVIAALWFYERAFGV
jgi:hypothetical protein